MAAPHTFTNKTAEAIFEWLASGKSLVAYCERKDTPGYRTVMRWLAELPEFRKGYALAREHQADFLAEEVLELADKSRIGKKTKKSSDGTLETTTGDMVERSRLQIDARKWYAAKLSPKKYSDKVDHTLSGPNGGPVEFAAIERTIVDPTKP